MATAYAGTIHFTSTDAQAALSADYKFTTTDSGVHTFTNGVTLKTVGTQSVTATQPATGGTSSITGSQTGIQVVSNAAVSFSVTGLPAEMVAGTTQTITVTVRDAAGSPATGYAGLVRITSSDYQAALPADYRFTSGASCAPNACDNGSHTFTVVLKSANRCRPNIDCPFVTSDIQKVKATDVPDFTITGESSTKVRGDVAVAIAVSTFPSPVTAGQTGNALTVAARDRYGNTASTYTGTVTMTSSDPQTVPVTFPLYSYDEGWSHAGYTLKTAGTQSISATDGMLPAIPQTGIVVVPAAASSLSLTGVPSPTTGVSATLTVEARDPYGNRATSYGDRSIYFQRRTGIAPSGLLLRRHVFRVTPLVKVWMPASVVVNV